MNIPSEIVISPSRGERIWLRIETVKPDVFAVLRDGVAIFEVDAKDPEDLVQVVTQKFNAMFPPSVTETA